MTTPSIFTPKIITVTQLNYYIKSLLDNDSRLNFVFLEGEISNLTDHYKSGHIYFSLKDEHSVIRAVMFSSAARMLRFKPKDGMKVLIRGRVTAYEASGQYQVYVEDMQPDGAGALSLAFEQLKEKLSKEGLFDSSHKKPIPQFPRTVGVITSPTGAAIEDILNILRRRFKSADIVVSPVLVQGESAPSQLTKAVEAFSKYRAADVVIIGRGGGSAEDLWAFNDERLARAIYNCTVPVISAVGHETDFTICDFVSDLRAPTPSAAAELAVPDSAELLQGLQSQRQYLCSLIDKKISALDSSLLNSRRLLTAYSPIKTVKDNYNHLVDASNRLTKAMEKSFDNRMQNLKKTSAKLEALSPVAVLNRGYSFTTLDGNLLLSVKTVKSGDTLEISLIDGTVKATADEVSQKEK